MIGQPMIDFVHPDDRARTLARVDNIYAGTKEPHFENRYVRKDGSTVHIMWSARWSPEAGVRVAVARDVTERKRAESMQAALYAVSERRIPPKTCWRCFTMCTRSSAGCCRP